MGATEGTKLDEDYTAMERVNTTSSYVSLLLLIDLFCYTCSPQKTDGLVDLIDDLLNRTKEYLQPNPSKP